MCVYRWSSRLGLHGPQRFRRYGAKPSTQPPSLPAGYAIRSAEEADIPSILALTRSGPVATSEYGSQNFVHSGWAEHTEAVLLRRC